MESCCRLTTRLLRRSRTYFGGLGWSAASGRLAENQVAKHSRDTATPGTAQEQPITERTRHWLEVLSGASAMLKPRRSFQRGAAERERKQRDANAQRVPQRLSGDSRQAGLDSPMARAVAASSSGARASGVDASGGTIREDGKQPASTPQSARKRNEQHAEGRRNCIRQ